VKFSEARRAGSVLAQKEILIYFSAAFDRSSVFQPTGIASGSE